MPTCAGLDEAEPEGTPPVMRVFGGVEFGADGVTIEPHPAIAAGRFELWTPLVSAKHDGAGRWSGHYSPRGPSAAVWLQLPGGGPVAVVVGVAGQWVYESGRP